MKENIWFTVSSANGRIRMYKVEIAESIKCNCEFCNQKDTACKHIILIFLYFFNIPELSYHTTDVPYQNRIKEFFL